MHRTITGRFDVERTGGAAIEGMGDDVQMARTRLSKQFHGELEATSVVEMMSVGTGVQGSAAYVALEQVSGMLCGRSGSFALQHSGTMARGDATLAVSVVPDSGKAGLEGLSGNLAIRIVDGGHHYEFDFILPDVAG